MGLRLSGAKDGGEKGEGHGAALIRSIEWAGLAIEPNRYTSNAIYVGQIVFIAERQQRQGGVDGGRIARHIPVIEWAAISLPSLSE